ncbi:MAG: GMC family oxidoreductase N-terminal domain-containing protein, partial [Acidobacteriota bacterium]|nr:GMC family oxidoreductase N-terminal domain-containing protein [Acidobacteriota bacterium]
MTSEDTGRVFDYVIVGAGTAGCVLANRLSENQSNGVCLIEAGSKDSHPFIHVPALVAAAMIKPSIVWGYWSAPQRGLNGRTVPIPRGRVLGGTSSINGMVYIRGNPRDYDDWAAAGNRGWSYQDVLPYFVRSENNEAFNGSPYHGKGGPMNVLSIKRPNPLNAAFWEAMQTLQFRRNDDFNGLDTEGYGPRQGTIKAGRRESATTAFLRPAMSRSNLTVLTKASVTRVVVENRRAIGVEIQQDGETRRILARREVILAAGSIGSPHILLLSGIGEGAALQALGIPVQHDLPGVGANYHDHVASAVLMRTSNSTSYGISLKALPRGTWNIFEYLLMRKGPFASNVFESHAFVKTANGLDRPDMQIVFQPARRNQSTFPLPIGHGYNISVVLLYPKSRGRIALSSPHPLEAPIIDPNILGEPEDIEPLVRGLKLARKILAAPA